MPDDVAQHECRRLQPGNRAQRRQVRLQPEVAVAPLPARKRVAGLRIHLHVEREQVVAALRLVPSRDLLEEEVDVVALPHQAALHVRERDDDGVDARVLELARAQHPPILLSVRSP